MTATLKKTMSDDHRRMARMLGYCLTLGSLDAWSGFRQVAQIRLTIKQRAALAFSALNSLELDQATAVAAAAIGCAGVPLPPFLGGMSEARAWAETASANERKAIALAAFEAMSPADRSAFVQHIQPMELAA